MLKILQYILLPSVFLCFDTQIRGQAIPVEVKDNGNGTFTLLRGGELYWIKGAGTSNVNRFAELAARGGNSVRTWGVDSNTRALLDSAHAHGLSVMLGLWIGRETDGFNYDNTMAVANQLEKIRQTVIAYKDHPAILAWAIGNEANIGYSNLKVWDAVNDISLMIHEQDGNHPTLTVTADISLNLANILAEKDPDLDLLGVNSYGGITGVPGKIQSSNWNKPYAITEWGINGPWEVSHTSWDAPIEPNSSEKAAAFQKRYQDVILANQGKILGSYAFLWNSKVEGTLTWFGLFVNDETTEMIDVLQYIWTAEWAGNRAPRITKLSLADSPEQKSYLLTVSENNRVQVMADDPEGDSLEYEFLIRPETGEEGLASIPGATYGGIPGIITEIDGNSAKLVFSNQHNNKNYRLYIFVRDGKGHVGTVNLPLRTELVDLKPELEFLPVQDAFIRDGIHSETRFGKTNPWQLQVKYSLIPDSVTQSYLLFDLTYAPESFSSARLELYGESPRPAELEALAMKNYLWDETELNWDNRNIPDSVPIASNWIQGTGGKWHSWDVATFLEKAFAQGARLITFILRGNTLYNGGPAVFESKEAGLNPPRVRFNSDAAGITEYQEEKVLIYPNPAGEWLNVLLPEDFRGELCLQLYTLPGKPVAQYIAAGNSVSLFIGDLPANIYFLRISGKKNSRNITLKFLKSVAVN